MAQTIEKLLLKRTPTLFEMSGAKSETLFETIALFQKRPQHLAYHQKRVNRTFKEYFKSSRSIDLQSLINNYLQQQNLESTQYYRLKVIYNREGVIEITHYPYQSKKVETLLLVEVPNASYSYKFTQRKLFDALQKNFDSDEFIITKDGYLTDTTIANIALYHKKEKQWHTPKKPLLKGTTRERLLETQKIVAKDIDFRSLDNYSNIALLNAMVEFKIL